MVRVITRGFPLWALGFAALAYALPAVFAHAKPAILPLLGLVMLGMGLTLTPANFAEAEAAAAARPSP